MGRENELNFVIQLRKMRMSNEGAGRVESRLDTLEICGRRK